MHRRLIIVKYELLGAVNAYLLEVRELAEAVEEVTKLVANFASGQRLKDPYADTCSQLSPVKVKSKRTNRH